MTPFRVLHFVFRTRMALSPMQPCGELTLNSVLLSAHFHPTTFQRFSAIFSAQRQRIGGPQKAFLSSYSTVVKHLSRLARVKISVDQGSLSHFQIPLPGP